MSPDNVEIPERLAPKVFALAARLYAEQKATFSLPELQQAGLEAQIPPEFIEQAWHTIQRQQAQSQTNRKIATVALVSLSAAIALWSAWVYNTLAQSAQHVDAAWAQLDNQFQRRADLIPVLLELRRSPQSSQGVTSQALVEARQTYLQAQSPAEKAAASQQMAQAIASFQSDWSRNSPKSTSPSGQDLKYELIGTENRIAVERRRYHQAVQAYNHQVQQFPNAIAAKIFRFEPKPYLSGMRDRS